MKALLFIIVFCTPFLAFAEGIKLIVNAENPVVGLTKIEVRDFFLKKNKHWPTGSAVKFFDRNDDSQERSTFLRQIIKKNPREVETFWIGQKLYTGLSSPTQVSSDRMMTSLVSKFPGAIGYVSSEYPVGKEVKFVDLKGE